MSPIILLVTSSVLVTTALFFPFFYYLRIEKTEGELGCAQISWGGGSIMINIAQCKQKKFTIFLRLLWFMSMKRNTVIDFQISAADALQLISKAITQLQIIQPRTLCLKIQYGFEDPYYTGMLYGFFNTLNFLSLNKYHMQLTPIFDHKMLAGTLSVQGRISLAKVIYCYNKLKLSNFKIKCTNYKLRRSYVS